MHQAYKTLGRAATAARGARRRFENRVSLSILGWHRIASDGSGLSTSEAIFVDQLECLEGLDAVVLPLDEAMARLEAGTLPKRAVALTFDDGYASVGTCAWPLLKSRGMPATLYVVPGFFAPGSTFPWDSPSDDTVLMTSEDVRALSADGMDIGSHSMSHRWLPGGDSRQVLADLTQSRLEIEALLGRAVLGLAYPTGGWNKRVRRLAHQAGYAHAVTVDRGSNLESGTNALSLSRAFAPDSIDELEMLLDGGFDYLRNVDRFRRRRRMHANAHVGW